MRAFVCVCVCARVLPPFLLNFYFWFVTYTSFKRFSTILSFIKMGEIESKCITSWERIEFRWPNCLFKATMFRLSLRRNMQQTAPGIDFEFMQKNVNNGILSSEFVFSNILLWCGARCSKIGINSMPIFPCIIQPGFPQGRMLIWPHTTTIFMLIVCWFEVRPSRTWHSNSRSNLTHKMDYASRGPRNTFLHRTARRLLFSLKTFSLHVLC